MQCAEMLSATLAALSGAVQMYWQESTSRPSTDLTVALSAE